MITTSLLLPSLFGVLFLHYSFASCHPPSSKNNRDGLPTSRSKSSSNNGYIDRKTFVRLGGNRANVCAYDRLRISWQVNLQEISDIDPHWQAPLVLELQRKCRHPHEKEEDKQQISSTWQSITSFDLAEEGNAMQATEAPSSPISSSPLKHLKEPIDGHPLRGCIFVNPIQCLLHSPFCHPKITGITLDDTPRIITVSFNTETTTPPLPTLAHWLGCLDPGPILASYADAELIDDEGAIYTHRWIDAKTLEARLPLQAFDPIYQVAAARESSSIGAVRVLTLRPNDCLAMVYSGDFAIRVSEPGEYRLYLSYAAANGSHVLIDKEGSDDDGGGRYSSTKWEVHGCGEVLVQERRSHVAVAAAESPRVNATASAPSQTGKSKGSTTTALLSRLPDPVLSSPGILSLHPTTKGLKIPHASLPTYQEIDGSGLSSSWALGMWIMLLEDAQGKHRTLFYKGDGVSERTPSAWLLPHSSHLTLRASVEGSPDLGSDSISALPVKEWVHLTFVFAGDQAALEDASKGEGESDVKYAMSLFINGQHDVTVKYKVPIRLNNGTLIIGKDPSHEGPRALLSHFKIWGQALSRYQVQMEFDHSKRRFIGKNTNPSVAATTLAVENVLGGHVPAPSSLSSSIETAGNYDKGQEEKDGLRKEPVVDLGEVMYQMGQKARLSCAPLEERLSYFTSAGKHGHPQGALQAAMLHLFGYEELSYGRPIKEGDNAERCPPAAAAAAGGVLRTTPSCERSTSKALSLLAIASKGGLPEAQRLLAFMLVAGVGVGPSLLQVEGARLNDTEWGSDAIAGSGERRPGSSPIYRSDVGNAVFESLVMMQQNQNQSISATGLAIGLLHLAAAKADSQAQLALAIRYRHGLGVEKDTIAAAFYLNEVAEVARSYFHAKGEQPQHEFQRLTDATMDTIEVGQRGEDDENLRYTMMKAEEGDVGAMMTMGDLHYWGTRGIERDHLRARAYFDRAATAGNQHAMTLAAGMYLKGEGGQMNHTHAVQLYEEAAKENNVRALNGLGYVYYTGEAVEKNDSKALEYFLRAAELETDGDSIYNAGHCLEHGLGGPVDVARAATFYMKAAEKFGHFDAVHALGKFSFEGKGVPQNFDQAIRYLHPAAEMGHWGRWLRAGFNRYLVRDDLGAYLSYLQAAELGYLVAHTNAAYLLHRRLDVDEILGLARGGGGDDLVTAAERGGEIVEEKGGLLGDLFRFVKGEEESGAGGGRRGHVNETTSSREDQEGAEQQQRCVLLAGREEGAATTQQQQQQQQQQRCVLLPSNGEEEGRQDITMSQTTSMLSSLSKEGIRYRLALRHSWLSHTLGQESDLEAALQIGDGYYYGRGGLTTDYKMALWWYSRASAGGVAQASYNMGYMYESCLGIGSSNGRPDFDRAERYYRHALQDNPDDHGNAVVCRLALARVTCRRWFHRLGLHHLYNVLHSLIIHQSRPTSSHPATITNNGLSFSEGKMHHSSQAPVASSHFNSYLMSSRITQPFFSVFRHVDAEMLLLLLLLCTFVVVVMVMPGRQRQRGRREGGRGGLVEEVQTGQEEQQQQQQQQDRS